MKKGMLCLIVMAVFLVSGIAPNTLAGGKSSLEEASDFMAGGQYQDAIAVLKNRLEASPKNAKAHFLLGVCYMNTGNVDWADSEFERAVGLQPSLAKQVGDEQIKAGSRHLENGRLEEANRCFSKAIIRNQRLRSAVAEKWFNASSTFFPWNVDAVDKCLHYSLKNDYVGMKDRVTGQYYALSKQSGQAVGLSMLIKANETSGGKYKNEISARVLGMCDNKSTPNERGQCLEVYSKYTNKEDIERSSLQIYTKLWGEPQKLDLDKEEWPEIKPAPKRGEKIHYLALNAFVVRDDAPQQEKWPPSVTSPQGRTLTDISGPLRCGKILNGTMVYVWRGKEK
jgi:tetratricopeptide (TPR) repeat protein